LNPIDESSAHHPETPAQRDDFFVVDDEQPEAEPISPPPDDHFSAQHIKQITKSRRAAYRTRSHAIIGTLFGLVACPELCLTALQHWRYHDRVFAVIAFIFAVATFAFAIWCARMTLRLHRAIRQQESQQDPPLPPPDFSTLSDGSHHWKNLE
jgi:hypothetical protein